MKLSQHTPSTSAVRLDRLLSKAHLASAPEELRAVAKLLRRTIDKSSLSKYRRGQMVPRSPTAATIEALTKALGDKQAVFANDWGFLRVPHTSSLIR